jgi:hypothetical protein
MSRAGAVAVVSAVLLTVTGCASNAIVGHRLTREGDWYGQLGVTGHYNNITVRDQSRLTRLSLIGDGNTVVLEDKATLAKVEIWGGNNTISVPENLVIREAIMGKGNRIVRRLASWKTASEVAPEPAPSGDSAQPDDTSEP